MRTHAVMLLISAMLLGMPMANAGGSCGMADRADGLLRSTVHKCAGKEPVLAQEDADQCSNRCSRQFNNCSGRCYGLITGRLGDTRANDCESNCRDNFDNCNSSCPGD